jgi:peptide/nickel transport system substrate-binding protein
MRRYHSRFVATKENKWQGQNFPRWINKEFDAAVDAAETETIRSSGQGFTSSATI